MVADSYSKIIYGERRVISAFNVAADNIPMSHVQFADDMIILRDAEEKSLTNLKHLICCFEQVSGLKVN